MICLPQLGDLTMRAFSYWLLCLVLIVVMACSKNETAKPIVPSDATSISLEQWRQMEHHDKYDGATLELLRKSDEKLMKSERAWKKFMNENVIPEMKKDIPPPTKS